MVARNSAIRNLVILEEGSNIFICTRIRIFGKVSGLHQKIQVLHRLGIESLAEIRTNIDSLYELVSVTDMNIGYLTYVKDL
jgi:hypothetical protein